MMTRWGEIKCREAASKCPRCAELEAQIAAMEEGLTAVHMAGYMDGKKAAADSDKQVCLGAMEELEAKLKTSEEIGRAFEEDAGQLRAKLAKQDDLIKERSDEVRAAVVAALTEAAECCTAQLRNTAMLMSNPPQSSAAWDARNAILALITPDAQAALDRAIASAIRKKKKGGVTFP